MEDKLKKIYEKATDIFFGITKKFDGISNKIYEQTGTKINIGLIIGSILIFLVLFFIVKVILGGVMDFLFGR